MSKKSMVKVERKNKKKKGNGISTASKIALGTLTGAAAASGIAGAAAARPQPAQVKVVDGTTGSGADNSIAETARGVLGVGEAAAATGAVVSSEGSQNFVSDPYLSTQRGIKSTLNRIIKFFSGINNGPTQAIAEINNLIKIDSSSQPSPITSVDGGPSKPFNQVFNKDTGMYETKYANQLPVSEQSAYGYDPGPYTNNGPVAPLVSSSATSPQPAAPQALPIAGNNATVLVDTSSPTLPGSKLDLPADYPANYYDAPPQIQSQATQLSQPSVAYDPQFNVLGEPWRSGLGTTPLNITPVNSTAGFNDGQIGAEGASVADFGQMPNMGEQGLGLSGLGDVSLGDVAGAAAPYAAGPLIGAFIGGTQGGVEGAIKGAAVGSIQTAVQLGAKAVSNYFSGAGTIAQVQAAASQVPAASQIPSGAYVEISSGNYITGNVAAPIEAAPISTIASIPGQPAGTIVGEQAFSTAMSNLGNTVAASGEATAGIGAINNTVGSVNKVLPGGNIGDVIGDLGTQLDASQAALGLGTNSAALAAGQQALADATIELGVSEGASVAGSAVPSAGSSTLGSIAGSVPVVAAVVGGVTGALTDPNTVRGAARGATEAVPTAMMAAAAFTAGSATPGGPLVGAALAVGTVVAKTLLKPVGTAIFEGLNTLISGGSSTRKIEDISNSELQQQIMDNVSLAAQALQNDPTIATAQNAAGQNTFIGQASWGVSTNLAAPGATYEFSGALNNIDVNLKELEKRGVKMDLTAANSQFEQAITQAKNTANQLAVAEAALAPSIGAGLSDSNSAAYTPPAATPSSPANAPSAANLNVASNLSISAPSNAAAVKMAAAVAVQGLQGAAAAGNIVITASDTGMIIQAPSVQF